MRKQRDVAADSAALCGIIGTVKIRSVEIGRQILFSDYKAFICVFSGKKPVIIAGGKEHQ